MQRIVVSTVDAPKAIGPYSQGIIAGNMVFISGQLPINPITGEMVEGTIGAMTRQIFDNLSAILHAAGTSLERTVKVTVFLADMNDFQAMNEAYAEFFPLNPPARSTIQVARLPRDARVEIELIAAI
ncbi:reactive intermediate/imine deaminase [Candidatus Chloroploca asiatica]|uniref:Reactive intermediate/imine deaminase n=1 Tax=Candidatus Chloroploca asiatica TaxID=1506545 RepID=A0A2H3L777_9CHLR|nr:reactive intermediate/imine deaminase [Candidatus Chloroploca asiatica]